MWAAAAPISCELCCETLVEVSLWGTMVSIRLISYIHNGTHMQESSAKQNVHGREGVLGTPGRYPNGKIRHNTKTLRHTVALVDVLLFSADETTYEYCSVISEGVQL
jgi:hypothetical protein